MNQQEWLKLRAELGLPADPDKDFPPEFGTTPEGPRHSGAAATPGLGATGRNHAAGHGSQRRVPATAASLPRKRPFVPWLAAALVLGVGLPVGIGLAASAPSDPPAATTGEAEQRALFDAAGRAVEAQMAELLTGSPAALSRSFPLLNPSTTDVSLLTGKGLAASIGENPHFELDSVDGPWGSTYANVKGRLVGSKRSVPIETRALREAGSDRWKMDGLQRSGATILLGPDTKFTLNGMPFSTDSGSFRKEIAAWPGPLEFKVENDKYRVWDKNALTLTVEDGHDSTQEFRVDWTPTPAFLREVRTQAVADLDRCLGGALLDDLSCPFKRAAGEQDTLSRNMRYTLLTPLGQVVPSREQPTTRVPGAKVRAVGEVKRNGKWMAFDKVLDVEMVGTASVEGGKVTTAWY